MELNIENVLTLAEKLLKIASPTGYTKEAIDFLARQAEQMGYAVEYTHKGNLIIALEGKTDQKVIGLSAHTDTLGLMVRSIKSTGTLAITKLGGPIMNTLDGEYCTVITRDNRRYSGTILSTSSAAHVFKDANTAERNEETMEIRLDEIVRSKEDVEKLGIAHGDVIAIDPKTTITPSGFIKSRFLDDKMSVAILFGLLQAMKENQCKPLHKTYILISTYEEVGHGSSYIPQDITELISVDMGCIGMDLACTEYDVSICAKDSGGPYDYELTSTLINLAKKQELQYAVDIYPFYGSDTGAALRGGNNIRGGLIGPGVAASHGMERTHRQAVENTLRLLMAYLLEEKE